ncbi:hypothetical protein Pla52o_44700 [Novipirellula galeiformis]|uniref:Uncharacterized protein n=1 Tax=Novipirellula galeiformis TaxID=2528004 RepID=A0A5C6C8T8_9BACT|nr:hypothetical protein Pla52o_44700 [Novipirellula galeiformis]
MFLYQNRQTPPSFTSDQGLWETGLSASSSIFLSQNPRFPGLFHRVNLRDTAPYSTIRTRISFQRT